MRNPFGFLGLGLGVARSDLGPDRTGLIGWYKGDAGVTSSGGLISLVADQSGSGNDISASGSARPSVGSTLNGLQTISFDGSANELRKVSASGFGSSLSVFAVIRCTVGGAAVFPAIVLQSDWTGAASGLIVSIASGDAFLARAQGFDAAATSHIAGPSWHRMSAVLRASGTPLNTLWTDGGSGSDDAQAGALASTGDLVLGNRAGNFLEMDLAEMLIYNADKTAQRTSIETYLTGKWGV